MPIGVGEVFAVRGEVARMTASLDPALLDTVGAMRAIEHLTAMERMLATARVALAAKVAETEQWRRAGFRSPQEWLAPKTGTSTGQAAQQLAVGKRLAEQPLLAEALKSGALSVEQAPSSRPRWHRSPTSSSRATGWPASRSRLAPPT